MGKYIAVFTLIVAAPYVVGFFFSIGWHSAKSLFQRSPMVAINLRQEGDRHEID